MQNPYWQIACQLFTFSYNFDKYNDHDDNDTVLPITLFYTTQLFFWKFFYFCVIFLRIVRQRVKKEF